MFRCCSAFAVCGLLSLPVLAEDKPATPSKEDVAAVAKANNQFAFDLYKQLAKQAKPDENIFFSPYSISAALAMTYAGAKGETAEQMAKVLHFDRNQEKFHPAFADQTKRLRNPPPHFKGEINVANAIWMQTGNIRPPFKATMDHHYDAGLRIVDFCEKEKARAAINGWAAQQTRNKIPELLPNGSIDIDTVMVLTNAIYFHAEWMLPFDPKKTTNGDFFVSPKDPISVPMMSLKTHLLYSKAADFQIVELPYLGKRFSMLVLLPASHDKLSTVEDQLDKLDDWLKKLTFREVEVTMPRVRLSQHLTLKETLGKMGLEIPFTSAADFTGIISRKSHIAEVYHEAALDIDEAGSTAAAATAVVNVGLVIQGPVKVVIDRPFLIAIRDIERRNILFVGKVARPVAK